MMNPPFDGDLRFPGLLCRWRAPSALVPAGRSGLAAAAHAAKSVTGAAGPAWPRIAAASAIASADGGRRALRRHGRPACPRAASTFFSSAVDVPLVADDRAGMVGLAAVPGQHRPGRR